MGSTLEDVSLLTRSQHRVSALVAMAARPRSRSELGENDRYQFTSDQVANACQQYGVTSSSLAAELVE